MGCDSKVNNKKQSIDYISRTRSIFPHFRLMALLEKAIDRSKH
jgi:hypothetical protein